MEQPDRLSGVRPNLARRFAIAAAAFAAPAAARAATAAGHAHRLAIQISENDPVAMNLALNNSAAAARLFAGRGEAFSVEIVAYGPGLFMLRADRSPVAARIAAAKKAMPGMIFSACHNTMMGMQHAEGHPIVLLPQARVVPAGVVRLMELQEAGWSYIRP